MVPTKNQPSDSSDSGKIRLSRSLYKQAMSYYKTGQYAQAGVMLEKLIDSPHLQGHLARFYHARSCRKLAENLMQNGQYSLASSYLQKALESTPNSPTLLSFLATCCIQQGKYDPAAESLDQLEKLNTSESATQFKKAMSHYLAGKAELAIGGLRRLAKNHPSSFDVNYQLGTILAAQEKPSQAIPYLTKAMRLRPENAGSHFKLGLAHGLCGHIPESVYHLQKAHEIDPEDNRILIYLNLAVNKANQRGIDVNIRLKKIDEIEHVCEEPEIKNLAELITKEPEFVLAFFDLPQTGMDEQLFSLLLQIILTALEEHPEYADLHYHCSCIYQRLGKINRAIEESEQAVRINPRYLRGLIQLGNLYSQTNQNSRAIDRLKIALANGANYADVHYTLGNLYKQQGQVYEALNHFQRALLINKGMKPAKQAIETLAV